MTTWYRAVLSQGVVEEIDVVFAADSWVSVPAPEWVGPAATYKLDTVGEDYRLFNTSQRAVAWLRDELTRQLKETQEECKSCERRLDLFYSRFGPSPGKES